MSDHYFSWIYSTSSEYLISASIIIILKEYRMLDVVDGWALRVYFC